jgi:F-type H+-transporting ATPase subunit epsilon
MMPSSLKVRVVTPEGLAFAGAATAVEVCTEEGLLMILPGHTPLVTRLVPGEFVVHCAEPTRAPEQFVLGFGFLRVEPDKVDLATDLAVDEDEIDVNAAEAVLARAREALRETEHLNEEDRQRYERDVAESNVLLRLQTRQRRSSP